MLKIVGIAPHPPVIVPEVGMGELKKVEQTVEGLKELCRRIKGAGPERLIIITPHGPVLYNAVAALAEDELTGDFGRFGAPDVKIKMSTDRKLLDLLDRETEGEPARPINMRAGDRRFKGGQLLDHGAMVPLYYLKQAGVSLPGLHLTYGLLPYRLLYRFGQSLRRAVVSLDLPTAVVASGDLSHRLTPGAPAGFNRRGAEFDQLLLQLLQERRIEEILSLDHNLVEDAAECGLRSFIIALGMLDGEQYNVEIISYEGTFGVGYLVAALELSRQSASPPERESKQEAAADERSAGHVCLARDALRHYLDHGRPLTAPQPAPPQFAMQAGAFVSLKKDGVLRGCIGTVEPTRKNLAEEIITNAVSAAVKDPRFDPVRREELDQLSITVDVLSPMERINGLTELDPAVYGVLVRSGFRSGLLLPDLDGVDTAEEQVSIARQKAGIAPGEPVELYRFRVTRYS